MSDVDEAMLIGWIDGELDEVTRRRVERAIADDPALAERADMHRRLRARLADHYGPVADEAVPDRLRAMLEEAGRVVPLVRPPVPAWRRWATGGAIAASLVVGLGLGHLTGRSSGPVTLRNGAMIAQGDLASALETQLASAQQGDAVRIGLSFRRQGGGWCRSFESDALAGVACREGRGWQVQQLVPGGAPSTDYRQASSGDARVLATIDALIDGDPADAQAEAAARGAGWK